MVIGASGISISLARVAIQPGHFLFVTIVTVSFNRSPSRVRNIFELLSAEFALSLSPLIILIFQRSNKQSDF